MGMWLVRKNPLDTDAWLSMPLPENADAWPDFGQSSFAGIKEKLRNAFPALPPEEYARLAERLSIYLADMHREDIVLIISQDENHLVCAEIIGHCRLHEQGYALPIRIIAEPISISRFKKFAPELRSASKWAIPVEDAKFRTYVRGCLKMPGSRFAGWKWILGALVALRVMMYMLQMLKTH